MASPHPSKAFASRHVSDAPARADAADNREEASSLLEGELLDLYGALLIVIPITLFLKSLWL